MLIYSKDLPSKGVLLTPESYELTPLNFKELMDYVGNPELTKLRNFIKDLRLLMKMDPKIGEASIIDAEYLIFMMKMLTISNEVFFNYSYKCSCCNKMVTGKISSTEIVFREIDPRYFSLYSIKVGDHNLYWHPVSIAEFIEITKMLPKGEDIDLKLLKVASMFTAPETPISKVLGIFNGAVGDDIKTVLYIKSAYFDVVKPVRLKCEKGGETVVGLNDLTTNMFQLLLQNRRLDTSKISFKQISEDQ